MMERGKILRAVKQPEHFVIDWRKMKLGHYYHRERWKAKGLARLSRKRWFMMLWMWWRRKQK
jgi:hypothetical protein